MLQRTHGRHAHRRPDAGDDAPAGDDPDRSSNPERTVAMRTTLIRFAAVVAAGMLNAATFAVAADAPERSDRSDRPQSEGRGGEGRGERGERDRLAAQAGDRAPEGFVLVEERVIVLTANEPQNHFLRAAQYVKMNSP